MASPRITKTFCKECRHEITGRRQNHLILPEGFVYSKYFNVKWLKHCWQCRYRFWRNHKLTEGYSKEEADKLARALASQEREEEG